MSETVELMQLDVQQAQSALARLAASMKETGGAAEDSAKKHEGFGHAVKEMGATLKEGSETIFFAAEAFNKLNEGVHKLAEMAELSAQMENLKQRVPVERLHAMQEATEGAVDKLTLMQFSLRAMQGDLHVTESGLNVVLAAAHNLAEKGFGTTQENAEKLMHALESGRTKELHEFNIQIDETKDKQTTLNEVLHRFKEIASEEVPVNEGLKQVERAQAAWKDFVIDVKTGLGDIIMTIGQGITQLLGLMPKSRSERTQEALLSGANAFARGRVPGAPIQPGEEAYAVVAGNNGYLGYGTAGAGQLSLDFQSSVAQYLSKYGRKANDEDYTAKIDEEIAKTLSMEGPLTTGKLGVKTGGGAGAKTYSWLDQFKYSLDGDPRKFRLDARSQYDDLLEGGQFDLQSAGDRGYHDPNDNYYVNDQNINFKSLQQKADSSKFQSQIGDRTTALGGAFTAMSSGLSAAVEAAITGSDSIGKAFMKASAAALKSIAIESTVRALYNTAMGLGSLYFDPPAAVGYFAAAATFGLAAAAAGAGSAVLGSLGGGGAGGATPTAGSHVPGSIASSAPQQQQGAQTVIVNVNGALTAGDYAKLGSVIQKATQYGQQAGRVRSQSSLTVSFE